MTNGKTAADGRTAWQRIAKRIRVPLGFVTAACFLLIARPSVPTLLWGLPLVAGGLWLRAYASGYVKKNAELTTSGPYSYTRNPLYLGSLLITLGFGVASGSVWLVLVLAAVFAAIYWPTIRGEEQFLRSAFPGFNAYAARVPRMLPRLWPAREFTGTGGAFSPALYRRHREYNAAMGAAGVYGALLLRLWMLRTGAQS